MSNDDINEVNVDVPVQEDGEISEASLLLGVFAESLQAMTEDDRELLTVVADLINEKLASFPEIPTLTDKV